MKRARGLLDWALEWDQLLAAARRARRGKNHRPEVLQYHRFQADHLAALRQVLADGSWQPSELSSFHISDPKPRLISVAPYQDRVAHHVLCAPLERLLEQRLRDGVVSNRQGRGLSLGLKLALRGLRRHDHFFRTDIQQYFSSIEHRIVKAQLSHMIKDHRFLSLLAKIIECCPSGSQSHRGLPIGNLSSQLLGNLYLNPIDQWLAGEKLAFVRYVDDLLVFGTRQELKKVESDLPARLQALCLNPHPKKTFVAPSSEPQTFLGFRICRKGLRLSGPKWRRFVAMANSNTPGRAAAGRGFLAMTAPG